MASNPAMREVSNRDGIRPKVLYLLADPGIPLTSSIKAGGVHARSMIRAFLDEGADVDVLAIRSGKGRDPLPPSAHVSIAEQGSFRRRWSRRYRYRTRPLWATGVEALLAQHDCLRTARKLFRRGAGPDVLYARHSWLPWSILRIQSLVQAPLFLEVNALFTHEKSERGELAFPTLTRAMEKQALHRAERILPVTEALSGSIAAMGLPEEKIRLSGNAVDLSLFDARLRADHAKKESSGFTIGLASSFRQYHGIGTLIDAVRLLEDRIGPTRVRLIGDGPLRGEVENHAKRIGLKSVVELPGPVRHQEVPALLASCDVCVAPYEGDLNLYNCPMKLFEYMALQIPIVASRWGEIPKILEHERTALLHDAGSPVSLAAMLERVFVDPEGALRRVDAAFDRVQAQTWRAHARWVLDQAAATKTGGS